MRASKTLKILLLLTAAVCELPHCLLLCLNKSTVLHHEGMFTSNSSIRFCSIHRELLQRSRAFFFFFFPDETIFVATTLNICRSNYLFMCCKYIISQISFCVTDKYNVNVKMLAQGVKCVECAGPAGFLTWLEVLLGHCFLHYCCHCAFYTTEKQNKTKHLTKKSLPPHKYKLATLVHID